MAVELSLSVLRLRSVTDWIRTTNLPLRERTLRPTAPPVLKFVKCFNLLCSVYDNNRNILKFNMLCISVLLLCTFINICIQILEYWINVIFFISFFTSCEFRLLVFTSYCGIILKCLNKVNSYKIFNSNFTWFGRCLISFQWNVFGSSSYHTCYDETETVSLWFIEYY